jgi:UDP-N-acetyl-2-amino-2-deoxyglucuronate dehydrogenase
MKKTGIGIIGTGAIAAKQAEAIRELENAELLALCSSDPERAKSAESKFQLKTYTSVSEFLRHPGLDIVSICTASGNHGEPTLQAARAGKHVIVEKPIEINLERADRMIKACEENGVKLGVIFQNRFNKDFLLLKKWINEGLLGKLLMGNAYVNWFRSASYYSDSPWKGSLSGDGGGAFINQGIHTIDLLLDIMGDVSSVFAQVKTVLYPIEGEDIGAALVNFKNGALGNITAATSLYPGYPERLEIYGTKGSVILEGGKIAHAHFLEHQDIEPIKNSNGSGFSDPMAIGHHLHLEQFRDFIEAVKNDREPLVNGQEARKSLALILGIYESSKINGPVYF